MSKQPFSLKRASLLGIIYGHFKKSQQFTRVLLSMGLCEMRLKEKQTKIKRPQNPAILRWIVLGKNAHPASVSRRVLCHIKVLALSLSK